MAERKAWWEILRDQFASRGLLDPESERVQETARAAPAVQRQARGLLSLDPQAESDAALEMGLGALPGVGQAMALRDLERARRAKDPGAAAMAASNFVPFGTLLNRFRRWPISELDVYHGTPHRFPATEANPLGEFDASKIGTGEGAQAYGHGLYLAEAPDVAASYKYAGAPSRILVDGTVTNPMQLSGVESQLDALMNNRIAAGLSLADAKAQSLAWLKKNSQWKNDSAALKSGNDFLERVSINDGNLYKADLPDEMIDRMLDWDEPLSEQPAAVRDVLMPLVTDALEKQGTPKHLLEHYANRKLGGELVKDVLVGNNLLTGNGRSRKDVSELLRQAGIPGIKYLDAGSRGQGGTGTRNFVVFPGEEKKVKILERK